MSAPSKGSPSGGPSVRYFRPSQYLFREGDHSNCLYLLQKGTVAVRKRKNDAEIELARLYSNEVLGELSFFDRSPRSASAIALTEVQALEINFEALDKIWANVPDYMKSIMVCVADRLRKANDTIRRLQTQVVKDSSESSSESGGQKGPSAIETLAVVENILASVASVSPESSEVAESSEPASGSDPEKK